MSWANVAGAAVSVVGGAIAGGSGGKPPKWRPMDTSNLWGSVKYNKKGRKMTQTLSPWAQEMANQFQGMASALGGDTRRQQGLDLQQGALSDLGKSYIEGQNYQLPPEALYGAAMTGMGNIAGGMGNLFGSAINNPYAQEQMDWGRQMMYTQPKSYDEVFNQRLKMLRDASAPFEERAQNSMFNKMHAMGQIGTPGGQLGVEAWGRGLGQADTQRALDAMNLSEGLYGRDLQAALQQQGTGANMFAGGVGNFLNQLQIGGQLGQLASGQIGNMYDMGLNWNELGYNRAQDRLARSEAMFGFGSKLEGLPLAEQAKYMNMLSGITGEQQKMAELGLQAAGPNGGAGPAGAANPWGQALGAGLMGSSQGIGNSIVGFFNKAGTTGGGAGGLGTGGMGMNGLA